MRSIDFSSSFIYSPKQRRHQGQTSVVDAPDVRCIRFFFYIYDSLSTAPTWGPRPPGQSLASASPPANPVLRFIYIQYPFMPVPQLGARVPCGCPDHRGHRMRAEDPAKGPLCSIRPSSVRSYIYTRPLDSRRKQWPWPAPALVSSGLIQVRRTRSISYEGGLDSLTV